MGTDSSYRLSYGNTYPAVAVPFGMNSWTPVTGEPGSGWGYTYDGEKINGIKQTHQPSPWMNDYAAFSLFAETGPLKIGEDESASRSEEHTSELQALMRISYAVFSFKKKKKKKITSQYIHQITTKAKIENEQ